jgi:hypothetical protein
MGYDNQAEQHTFRDLSSFHKLRLPKKTLSVIAAAGVLIGSWNILPNRNYDIEPQRYNPVYDDVAWKFLRIPLLLCGGVDKIDDGWHWYKQDLDPNLKGMAVDGDPSAFIRTSWIDTWKVSCAGWPTVLLVQPQIEDPALKWQIGYRGKNDKTNKLEVNDILLTGPTYLMRGPGQMEVYGFTYPDHTPIDLNVEGPFLRSAKPVSAPLI